MVLASLTGYGQNIGDEFTDNDIKYGITSVTPNEVKIIDYIGSATEVEIPETVDDNGETYTVTAIGANAFNDNPDLALVTVEATHPHRFTKMHLQIAAR